MERRGAAESGPRVHVVAQGARVLTRAPTRHCMGSGRWLTPQHGRAPRALKHAESPTARPRTSDRPAAGACGRDVTIARAAISCGTSLAVPFSVVARPRRAGARGAGALHAQLPRPRRAPTEAVVMRPTRPHSMRDRSRDYCREKVANSTGLQATRHSGGGSGRCNSRRTAAAGTVSINTAKSVLVVRCPAG